jgi:hypothetical protein
MGTKATRSERALDQSQWRQNSPFGSLPPLVPMFEPQNPLDVQLVFTGPVILCDPVNQYCDSRHRGIHPVEQTQFEWH